MSTFFRNSLIAVAVLLVGCSRVGERLSVNQAKHELDFPLVPSATNVLFYQDVGGLQSLDRFIRFDISVADISNQVNIITANNNKLFNRSLPYSRTNLQAVEVLKPINKRAKLYWWNPEKIKNGYYVGEKAGYSVQIWVDEDCGTLFIHQGD